MIFVTVGTHEQPFNRLIAHIDNLKADGTIHEDVIIQTGFCTYEPQYCNWNKFFSYQEMNRHIKDARIIITHGGPSSFLASLREGKIPIVVPRQKQFYEHVNNHQIKFCRAVAERQGNIIIVENINDLKINILNYSSIISTMPTALNSNNKQFNEEFKNLVNEIFKDKK